MPAQHRNVLRRMHHPIQLNICHGLPLQGLNITNYLVGALDAITARELLRQDVHTFNMYEDGTELPAGELTGFKVGVVRVWSTFSRVAGLLRGLFLSSCNCWH